MQGGDYTPAILDQLAARCRRMRWSDRNWPESAEGNRSAAGDLP